MHWPPHWQVRPAAQSLCDAQLVLQATAPQTNGLHACIAAAGQLPAEQLDASVSVPAAQLGPLH